MLTTVRFFLFFSQAAVGVRVVAAARAVADVARRTTGTPTERDRSE